MKYYFHSYANEHFRRIIEIDRESEEIFAIVKGKIEIYERKWDKYVPTHLEFENIYICI